VALTTEYAALNVASKSANSFYLDPITQVKIWKTSDATTPVSNTGVNHDYAEGGPYCSRGWGTNGNHFTICAGVAGVGYYSVDFERGVGISNWRPFPAGGRPVRDINFCFSNNPATPRIAYSNIGGSIVRINTETNQVENTGYFPHTFSGDDGAWVHQDKNDEWFVYMVDSTAWVWNSKTNQTLSKRPPTRMNEPRMERNGRYVAMVTDGQDGVIWDLKTDQIIGSVNRQPYSTDGTGSFAHNSSSAGFFISINPDLSWPSRYWLLDPSQVPIKPLYISNNAFWGGEHKSGNWIQDSTDWPNGDFRRQWVVSSSYSPVTSNNSLFIGGGGAQGYLRYNGGPTTTDPMSRTTNSTDFRLLCHSYHATSDYWALPFGTTSPDGKIFIFNSDMMASGRFDLFVVEVPLTAGTSTGPARRDPVSLRTGSPVIVNIHDIRGRLIRRFISSGDIKNEKLLRELPQAGVFLVQLKFPDFCQIRKIVRLK
jgi:hypothetical protein